MALDFQSGADWLYNTTDFPGKSKTFGSLFWDEGTGFSLGGTVAFWMNIDTFGDSGFGHVIHIQDPDATGLTNEAWRIYVRDTNDSVVFRIAHTAVPGNQEIYQSANNSITTGSWIHICVTYGHTATASARTAPVIYINGSVDTPSSTTAQGSDSAYDFTGFGATEFAIGDTRDTTRGFDGRLAELVFYDGILDAQQAGALASGVSPLLVAPNQIDSYFPFTTECDCDYMGKIALTVGAAPAVAAHPRIIQPTAQILPFPPSAAPPAGSYTIYNNYYRQLLAGNV
jgi:hypothetical protein